MNETRLYDIHIGLNAKMAEFGGYTMPIQYSGIMKEHQACREGAALFDTDHMGVFMLSGESSIKDIEHLVSCDVDSMAAGQCRYGLMCNERGGVIDDLIVYRLSDSDFILVVNAGTKQKDFDWISGHLSADTHIEDRVTTTAKVDLQGPKSVAIIQKLLSQPVTELKYFRFMNNEYRNSSVIVSRTGYTGELGFEIYLEHQLAPRFWNDCMELGAVPAGLGARDTLRLEMGMPLYGHELDTERNAGESGLVRASSCNKEFIGSSIVNDTSGRRSRLVGLELKGRRAARHGDEIIDATGACVGYVTSGSFAPSLGYPIALGYVEQQHSDDGTELTVRSPRYELDSITVSMPFYKEATGRRPIDEFLL